MLKLIKFKNKMFFRMGNSDYLCRREFLKMTEHTEGKFVKSILILSDKLGKKVLPQEIVSIVQQHSVAGTASAIIPAPGAGMVAAIANVWAMYARINSKMGIEMSEYDGKLVAKTILSGVTANLGSAAVGALIGEGLKFIPVVGTVAGIALTGAVFYATTIVSALIYLEVLGVLISKHLSMNSSEVAEAVKVVIAENKGELKDIYNESKKSYKPAK